MCVVAARAGLLFCVCAYGARHNTCSTQRRIDLPNCLHKCLWVCAVCEHVCLVLCWPVGACVKVDLFLVTGLERTARPLRIFLFSFS